MDRSMASSLPTEKLDRTNYASWSYKMHQYLLGHGYWSYVEGANDTAPESTHRDFPANTTARKLQLRQELSNLRQRDMSVADYTSKIKDICDSLASIELNIEESEMVQIFLGGLAQVRSVPNGCVHPEEDVVLFRITVDAPARGEPCGCIHKHAHRQQDAVHAGR